MDALVDLEWRAYPASVIIAGGLLLVAYGAEQLVLSWRRSIWDAQRPIVWVTGFRAAVVGLAVVGVGAAWISQQLWVLLIALAIGGEELLETSVILFALRRGRRVQSGA
jgi:hypothetical protein